MTGAWSLPPLNGPEHARDVIRRCRAALGSKEDPTAVDQDALLLIICAKGIDETSGAPPRFGIGERRPARAGAALGGWSRFRKPPAPAVQLQSQLDRAGRWLELATRVDGWPELRVTPDAAHEVLSALGPWSLLRTAHEAHGPETLRALFAEIAGPTGHLAPGSAFARPGPATQLLDTIGFKRRSARLRTVAVAGAKGFGELGRLKERNLEWMRGNYKKAELELTNFPKLIHVELSTKCNLACRTCSITRPGRDRELTYLSMDTLERLRPALPYISDCKLHGGGEPFMHPQVDQVIEVFRDEGVRLNTVTNATLIRERLGRLIGETFSSLTVSVDGADRETFEYVRLGATWDRLLRGLGHINEHRNRDFRLVIGVVMLKCNIHQLPDFVRFAHEHGAQEMQAAWLVPFHDLPWTQEQGLTDDPVRTNYYLDAARALGDELGVSVRVPDNLAAADEPVTPVDPQPVVLHPYERGADRAGARPSTIVALDHEPTYWNLHGTDRVEGQCRLMYDRAMILVDGTVKPCGQSRSVKDLGSVHDRSFEACWNGDGYQRLRRTFNSGTLPRTCQSCNFIRSKQLGSARLVY